MLFAMGICDSIPLACECTVIYMALRFAWGEQIRGRIEAACERRALDRALSILKKEVA